MPVPFQARTERDLNRPGYCALSHMRKFITLVALGRLRKGDVITARRLKDEFDIPRSEIYLVIAAARHLDFIDEQNRITHTLEELVHATGDDYPKKFVAVLEEAYPDIFNSGLDLAHATPPKLKKAFEACNFEPSNMQMKMVTLFRDLCRMAGIVQVESNGSQAVNGQIASNPSSLFSLNAVPLTLTEFKPMSASSLPPKTNGTLRIHTDYTVVEEILASIEELHQELFQSTDWTETDQEKWEKFLKINHTMLGNALKLLKRAKSEDISKR